MEADKVGIREFRAGLSEYIASDTPIAVTRHGQTVGYFIPARGNVEAELGALRKATRVLDSLLEQHSLDVETLIAEYKQARRKDRAK